MKQLLMSNSRYRYFSYRVGINVYLWKTITQGTFNNILWRGTGEKTITHSIVYMAKISL